MANFRDLLKAAKSEITEVDTAGAADLIDDGWAVLDVREPEEFDAGAIPGAVHIPRGHLESQIEGRLTDKTKPVVVYCARGGRAQKAKDQLDAAGYTHVVNGGGYDDLR